MADNEIVLMKRDISCNSNKIEELKKDFKERDPARETYDRLNQSKIEMTRMGDKLDNLIGKLDTHIGQQKEDFDAVKSDIGDIKRLMIRFIIGTALVAGSIVLGYILTHVGLPKGL